MKQRLFLLALALLLTARPLGLSATPRVSLPLCSGIRFTASYLSPAHPGGDPGFLFRIENGTAHRIALAQPVPSSTHWYARAGQKYLWRASSGSGGDPVDLLNARSRLFAYTPAHPAQNPMYLTVPAHGAAEWVGTAVKNASLDYRPSCEQCNYPGEHQFRAVFAYAYLPPASQHAPELLGCALRSNPVDMPPLTDPKHPAAR